MHHMTIHELESALKKLADGVEPYADILDIIVIVQPELLPLVGIVHLPGILRTIDQVAHNELDMAHSRHELYKARKALQDYIYKHPAEHGKAYHQLIGKVGYLTRDGKARARLARHGRTEKLLEAAYDSLIGKFIPGSVIARKLLKKHLEYLRQAADKRRQQVGHA